MLELFFAGGGITVRVAIICEIDVVLTCVFCKNHTFFVFLAWDSISQPRGEGDFAIHYTMHTQLLGSLAPLFLFVYKSGYLRALTVYVWSEHLCGISLFWLLWFLLFHLLFFFHFTGCWLESSVRGLSFFREVFVLFSFKFRSSFAPRRVASCQTIKR
jgi:Zn-dependent protease with chaperone function